MSTDEPSIRALTFAAVSVIVALAALLLYTADSDAQAARWFFIGLGTLFAVAYVALVVRATRRRG
jgi:hypothetical protein